MRKRAAFAEAESLLRRGLAVAEACSTDEPYPEIAAHIEALAALLRDTNRSGEAEPLLRRSIELSEKMFGPHTQCRRRAQRVGDLAALREPARRSRSTLSPRPRNRRTHLRLGSPGGGAPVPQSRAPVARDQQTRGSRTAARMRAAHRRARSRPAASRRGQRPGEFRLADLPDRPRQRRRTFAAADDDIRAAAYGTHHPSYAHAVSDVAVLLHDTGRFSEAELLYGQALAIYEASYGADHPVVAACLNNVAELYADDGRFEEAEKRYRRALGSDEATYGPDHANVARDLNNLAGLLAASGRAAEAQPCLARASAILERHYASDHPRVQIVRDNALLLEHWLAEPPASPPAGPARWRNIRRSPSRGLR